MIKIILEKLEKLSKWNKIIYGAYNVLGDYMEILRLNSTGPLVELLQSILNKLGLYNNEINGIFDSNTYEAVRRFQGEFGLMQDGIVR